MVDLQAGGRLRSCVLISYDFTTRIAGASHRALAFVRALTKLGFHVLVITSTPKEDFPAVPDGVRLLSIPSCERTWGGGIQAGDTPSLGGNPTWLRALSPIKTLLPLERQLSWTWPFLRKAPVHCRGLDVAAVITITAPYSMMPLGHALARRVGALHVIDLRDDWVDRFRSGWRDAVSRRIGNAAVMAYARRAAVVSAVNFTAVRRLEALGVSVRLVPNGFVESSFAEIPMVARPVEPTGPLEVVHLGWMSAFRDLSGFVHGLESLAAIGLGSEFRFTQIGLIDEDQRDLLERSPVRERIRIEVQVPHEEAVRRMANADVLLAVPGHEIPGALSGKLYEYLRSRRPILLLARPGAAVSLLQAAGEDWIADPDDEKAIASLLEAMVRAKRDGGLVARSKPDFVKQFDRDLAADEWALMVKDLSEKPRQER